jgi:hypothetical protein
LYDRLSQHFGRDNLFMDVAIALGLDFVEAIQNAVGSCDVLLAVIGGQWLTNTDPLGHRRLDNPEDFVRLEITTALERRIRVIPVLVGGASMPRSPELPDVLQPLARRQALVVGNHFHPDVDLLIAELERVLGVAPFSRELAAEPSMASSGTPPHDASPITHSSAVPPASITSSAPPLSQTPNSPDRSVGRYDFFIFYATPDRQQAENLCWFLQDLSCVVFLDVEAVSPGALWPDALREALEASRVIVVLVSAHTDDAFYQQEEIGRAIQLARDKPRVHTVIPVILDKKWGAGNMPYGMNALQVHDTTRPGGLKRVACELVEWLEEQKRLTLNSQKWPTR